MKKIECKKIFWTIVFLCLIQYSHAEPEYAKNGMVVSANHLASEEVELFLFPQFAVPLTNILL